MRRKYMVVGQPVMTFNVAIKNQVNVPVIDLSGDSVKVKYLDVRDPSIWKNLKMGEIIVADVSSKYKNNFVPCRYARKV